jgi:hypothetical protein
LAGRENQGVDAQVAERALRAALEVAAGQGLAADDSVVLSNSNRLVVLVLPCRTVARVSIAGWFSAASEVDVVRRLQALNGPVAGLDPRVEPHVFERDGFEIAMWTYIEPLPPGRVPPSRYARALEQLHDALGRIDLSVAHVTDRVDEVRAWLADDEVTPDLTREDRALLVERLEIPGDLVARRHVSEQVLHGEPHAGNVLATGDEVVFIDFENCARGPVEYDLAWVPSAVASRYRDADLELLGECRRLVLAIVAAHRWRRDDDHPSGRPSGVAFLDVLRTGPPWPALDAVHW